MMNKTSTISIIVLIVLSLSAVSCSIDPISPTEDNDQLATRSFDQLKPEDFRVTRADLEAYLCLVANGNGKDLSNDAVGPGPQCLVSDRKQCYYKEIKVRAYPNDISPAFYIVNYPFDRWEIISTDKRTSPVLAAGKGRFVLDSVNMNMKGWLKSMSNRIQYLKKNSCPVKNAEERVTIWNHKIAEGNRWRKAYGLIETVRPDVEQLSLQTDSSVLTRSGSAPDTSYHPAPGHYQLNTFDNYTFSSQSRLTSTTWGGGAPYNQYCPIYSDIPSMHANAGSEAVAGGQMVYYMHYNCDLCPEVYSAAFCTAHIGDD
ncbi:MAG: Spi family protease inhibitor, partial [Bacteroidales bacterium]|nr:Spi family protease inhibitor [Bacteroidales bacterium]